MAGKLNVGAVQRAEKSFAWPSWRDFFQSAPTASVMQSVAVVRGAITGRDVLKHSFTIVRLWGPLVYFRCLRAVVSKRSCTFLGVLAQDR